MTRHFFVTLLFVFASFGALLAQKGHNIRLKLDNYEAKSVTLGFHYGEKQYVKDTAALGADGFFTFKADTLLPSGVYLFVLKPDNNFIQVLLPAGDQDLTMTTDAKAPVDKMKVKGSDENETFYNYLGFLNKKRPEADTLRAQLARVKSNKADSVSIANQINDIDKQVKKYH
jgi:Domain of unknown function (DUF4369)